MKVVSSPITGNSVLSYPIEQTMRADMMFFRYTWLLLTFLVFPVFAQDPSEESEEPESALPYIKDKPLPSYEQLIGELPRDWVVFKSERVLEAAPVVPRPNTLDEMDTRIKESFRLGMGESEEHLDLYYLQIFLLDGDDRTFRLHQKHVKEIIYFEDLVLKKADELLAAKDTPRVYELLSLIDARNPNWEGLAARQEKLLAVEALVLSDRKDFETALGFLEELYRRNPEYPMLVQLFDELGLKLVESSVTKGDYRRARHFLERIRRNFPESDFIPQGEVKMQELASAKLSEALTAEQADELQKAALLSLEAARIWPKTPDEWDEQLTAAFRRIHNRWQRLPVGVMDRSDLKSPGRLKSSADARIADLVQLRLFEPARYDGSFMRYRSPIFSAFEPTELGRSLDLEVNVRLPSYLAHQSVSAGEIVSQWRSMLDPENELFNERLSGYVDRVGARSPMELSVEFFRVPLRPEALFNFSLPGPDGTPIERFTIATEDPKRVLYHRVRPETSATNDYHIAEIEEIQYENYVDALRGLIRGDVLYWPSIPLHLVKRLQGKPEFAVTEQVLPVTHVLQFHPNSQFAKNRALRRALVFCLDNQKYLNEIFMTEADPRWGKTTSAPFPSTSYAYNINVAPHQQDRRLAVAMAEAAKKELEGKLPQLRLTAPQDPQIQEAVKRFVKAWKIIGIEVVLVKEPPTSVDLEPNWDLAYREICMVEPVYDLWPFLTLEDHARVESLASLPHWLRQELISIEQSSDWPGATIAMQRIHKHLAAEVQMIPLWELSEFHVIRRTVRGLPNRPMTPYDSIDQWQMQPWFSRENP